MSPREPRRQLSELARLYGLQGSYTDVRKVRRRAAAESLLAVLGSLDAPVRSMDDVPRALRERRGEMDARVVDHVTVAWERRDTDVSLRLPARPAPLAAEVHLQAGTALPVELSRSGRAGIARLPTLPPGYHRLVVRAGAVEASSLVVSAPRRCPDPPRPLWGVFLPLYALRARGDWGVGSFAHLDALTAWTAGLGGSTVGTLPLLAAFLEEDGPFEPSPYSPVSRLYWNELFVDVEGVPEFATCAEARELVGSPGFRADIRRARRGRFVDYPAVAGLKRRALEPLARAMAAGDASERRREFERALREDAPLRDYARFRACTERRGSSWHVWPARQQAGRLTAADVDPDVERYHAYVQWVAAGQLAAMRARNRGPGQGLYLDLPLGVHPDGYDTWRHREAFASGANGGAPPDPFFTGGQEWGFPPLHPERIRETGYAYPIACLRHLLRHAGVLRIDHVMGLHRLFWVPHGMPATKGVYVRYHPQEWYAILALEAGRAGALVLGEDLGTVPRPVRHAMKRHGVLRSHVAQMEVMNARRKRLPDAPAGSVATLNTHDMPPFAAFWTGADVSAEPGADGPDRREAQRHLAERAAARRALLALLRERGRLPAGSREPGEVEVAGALLEHLAAGPAALVVANLEDLWGETQRQNRPGTHREAPNWRLRAERTLEQVRSDPAVVGTLSAMDRLRGEGP